jgi:hypothetical protein
MRNGLRLTLLVLALTLQNCGGDSNRERKPVDKSRPFRRLVEEHRGKPLPDRMAVYLPLAQRLNPATKTRTYEESLHVFARELMEAGEYEVLEALEGGLEDGSRRRVLWEAVSYPDPTEGGRQLAVKWASANPEVIVLARFRSGGVEYLLSVLENELADPTDRARSARELGLAGDVSVIPRMRRLEDDRTPVHGPSMRAGGPIPTLGETVKWGIEKLEPRQPGD